ncbi:hypothetical protein N9L68_02875 [bacterium]|nr:hypothetical protein [bacterium]
MGDGIKEVAGSDANIQHDSLEEIRLGWFQSPQPFSRRHAQFPLERDQSWKMPYPAVFVKQDGDIWIVRRLAILLNNGKNGYTHWSRVTLITTDDDVTPPSFRIAFASAISSSTSTASGTLIAEAFSDGRDLEILNDMEDELSVRSASQPAETPADGEDERSSPTSQESLKPMSPRGKPTGEANLVDKSMREYWKKLYNNECDEALRSELARLLFMKRKRMDSADASQICLAFASQEETCQAIRDVLGLRRSYLRSKGIEDLRHVLAGDERAELTKRIRDDYEGSEEQRVMQDTDRGNWQRQNAEKKK